MPIEVQVDQYFTHHDFLPSFTGHPPCTITRRAATDVSDLTPRVKKTTQKTWLPSPNSSAMPVNLPKKIWAGTFINPLNGNQMAMARSQSGKKGNRT